MGADARLSARTGRASTSGSCWWVRQLAATDSGVPRATAEGTAELRLPPPSDPQRWPLLPLRQRAVSHLSGFVITPASARGLSGGSPPAEPTPRASISSLPPSAEAERCDFAYTKPEKPMSVGATFLTLRRSRSRPTCGTCSQPPTRNSAGVSNPDMLDATRRRQDRAGRT